MSVKRPFDLAIFDLDGTIMNTIDSLAVSGNAMLASFGHQPVPASAYPTYVGNGARELVKSLMRHVSVETEEGRVDRYLAAYLEQLVDHCTDGVVVFPGVLDLIRDMREAGYRTAVLTNKPHGQAERVIAHGFPSDAFDLVIGQRQGHARKPDPSEALAIAARLGARPEKTVVVGDGDTDILTGKHAGMSTIAVSWGYRPVDMLRALKPDHLVFDLPALYNVLLPPPRA